MELISKLSDNFYMKIKIDVELCRREIIQQAFSICW